MRTSHGRRLFVAALAFGATTSITPVAPIGASPRSDVHIEVETLFSNATVPFTASGGAVDDGVLCDAGTVTTVANLATGWQSGQTMNFHVDKEFSCPDGAFVVRLSAHLGRDGVEFRWVVIDGDGAYSGLAGSGSGVGLPLPDGSTDGVFDVYDGALIAS